MKKTALLLITFYQGFISPLIKQLLGVQRMCRYTPTCSEYTKTSIQKYGIIKGIVLGIRRILSCQPYFKISNY